MKNWHWVIFVLIGLYFIGLNTEQENDSEKESVKEIIDSSHPKWLKAGGDGVRPGVPMVYAEIELELDCDALQKGLNKNADDHDRRAALDEKRGYVDNFQLRKIIASYVEAYRIQMEKINCY